jgi:hypothetical protein
MSLRKGLDPEHRFPQFLRIHPYLFRSFYEQNVTDFMYKMLLPLY